MRQYIISVLTNDEHKTVHNLYIYMRLYVHNLYYWLLNMRLYTICIIDYWTWDCTLSVLLITGHETVHYLYKWIVYIRLNTILYKWIVYIRLKTILYKWIVYIRLNTILYKWIVYIRLNTILYRIQVDWDLILLFYLLWSKA